MKRSNPNQFYVIALRRSFIESEARPTGLQLKWGNEAESFLGDTRPIVTIILCEKRYFDA